MQSEPMERSKRLFVAIFPSAAVVENLRDAMQLLATQLPASTPIRWTKPEQIHITLSFLEDVESRRVNPLESALETICWQGIPHWLEALGVGCFPSASRPRILWAGIAGALEELKKLKASLDRVLAPLGWPPETRPFHPHLTFGRFGVFDRGWGNSVPKALSLFQQRQFGKWEVERLQLMQSILSPKGASYLLVNSFPLGRAE